MYDVSCSTLFGMCVRHYSFEQLISENTRLNTEGAHAPFDLILTNDPFIIRDVEICDLSNFSDHLLSCEAT